MNQITDTVELSLLCQEDTQQSQQISFLWDTNTAVTPTPCLKDHAERENYRAVLLNVEGLTILNAACTEVVIDGKEDWSGRYLVDKRSKEYLVLYPVTTEQKK